MATRKFNFGKVDEVLVTDVQKEDVVNSIPAKESDQVSTESKTPVVELIKRIDRPSNGYKKAFDSRLVPRHKIAFHEKNDYPMEAVESLAELILEFGLIENIEVYYDEEKDIYVVEAGEQRTRAIDLLIEKYDKSEDADSAEYKDYLENVKQFAVEGYPCNVKRKRKRENMDSEKALLLEKIDSEVRLIIANESGREKNTERTRTHVERLNYLLTERNKMLDNGNKINVNKEIGKKLHITERQVQNYKTLSKLIPELQLLFEKRGISIKEGAKYAMLDEAEQRQILELIEAGTDKKEITALQEKMSSMQREIDAGKKEVLELENEKQKALEAVEREKQAAAQLEERIREEIDTADKQHIEYLQQQLEISNRNLEKQQKRSKKLEEDHDKKVADLELKLAAKNKQALIAPTKIARQALKLESILESLEVLAKQFEREISVYQEIYDTDTGEMSPEEYKVKISEILRGIA